MSNQKFMERVRRGNSVTAEEITKFQNSMTLFCDVARISLISLSDADFAESKFVVPVGQPLNQFISSLSEFVVGLIRLNFGQSKSIVSSRDIFKTVIPIAKLLRGILDRTSRIANVADPRAWHVQFAFSDGQVVRRLHMLNGVDPSDKSIQGINDGTSSDKQVMTVLNLVPFAITFGKRIDLFYSIVHSVLEETNARTNSQGRYPIFRFNVRRHRLYDDAYSEMSDHNFPDWRSRFAVQFLSDGGRVEAGIGAGVNSEFLEDVLAVGFDPNRGLFLKNANEELYPNPAAQALYPDTYRQHYRFLGSILGRLIFEKHLVKLPLASFFVAKLLRGDTSVDMSELQSLDSELYRNLMYLKRNPSQVESLSLTFTVTSANGMGGNRDIDLVPRGSNIPVTEQNYTEYIIRVADYHLNRSIKEHCVAFRDGFNRVIDQAWIKLFNQREFDVIIQGVHSEIDIDDLEENSLVTDLGSAERMLQGEQTGEQGETFSKDHPTIVNLWRVLRKFTGEEKIKFLRFVTSNSRAPLRGFGDLHPKFTITNSLTDTNHLPSSSTCVNLLRLPPYETIEILEERLRKAIEANTFENT